jgi:hypothetical protein
MLLCYYYVQSMDWYRQHWPFGEKQLTKGDKKESEAVPLAQQAYRKGVAKLLHVTRWTRPDIMNSVRELSRFAGGALMAHMKAMYRCMAFCVATAKRGINIAPNT